MLQQVRKIELLAPARNFDTGIAAVNNGADAVYIGASHYGARQAAGNSVEDISRLVDYAHLFGVKVYVTLNTILEDADIPHVEKLVRELYDIGVDALIVQDMAFLEMNLPPIPLHASTQADNRNAEKVHFLASVGFPRVVLARELSLKQIETIHAAVPDTELEVFVHGALCVSYSGQCYASQHCFGRSANRGECAQFCRLPFTLVDADEKVICKDKHLLSLKDMNRSDYLEQMLDAGVTSFKIEGRLKDISYVKNVTAFYRMKLDEIIARRKEFARASFGDVTPQFIPVLEKSFNRGFTDYFLNGKKDNISSFVTPKSIGEYMGSVRVVARNFFTMQNATDFSNGDGACFVGNDGRLHGFRINKVEGGRIFPQSMPQLFSGAEIYRNYDNEFEKQLLRPDTPRRLFINLVLSDTDNGFCLTGKDESGCEASINFDFEKTVARKPQWDNIVTQLEKWGNTPFKVQSVEIHEADKWFVPSSLLSEMRRSLCDAMLTAHREVYKRESICNRGVVDDFKYKKIDYKGNVSNSLAVAFYKKHGVDQVEPAFELNPIAGVPIMFCKHCIKYSMGWCSRNGVESPYREPYYLVSADGRRFRLDFDCKGCQMCVMADDE